MSKRDDINIWLGYLEQVLAPLPASERDDIVGEARAHLEERVAAGLTATSALAGFGKAETYARPFLDDHMLDTALDSKRSVAMLKALMSVAGQSLTAVFGLLGFLVFGATTLAAIACILVKIARPELVGLWIAPDVFQLGIATNRPPAPEIMGAWIYVVLAALVIFDALLARLSLVLALKGIKGQTGRD